MPIGWVNSNGSYRIEGRDDPAGGGQRTNALYRAVGPDYFSTLGVALVAGREIDRRDTAGTLRAVVINEAMARASWPGRSSLRQRIRLGWMGSRDQWMTIVGVVQDTRQVSLDRRPGPELFLATAQHPIAALNVCLVARTSLEPLALADSLRRLARHLDPEVPVKLTTAEQMVTGTLAAPRFRALLLGLFAVAALLLAVIGVAGVMGCIVAERTREIGIRMAIGARPAHILRQFLLRGLRLTLLGMAIGLVGALAAARVLRGLLFGVGTADPGTVATVSALLVVAALAAAGWPALQAARTSPMTVLHNE